MSNTVAIAFNKANTANPMMSHWDAVSVRELKRQDGDIHKFMVNGKNVKFESIPSRTSNFDIFCFCHPELDTHAHHTIWNYYRDLFIRAKLKNEHLTNFRLNLRDLVTEKYHTEPNANEQTARFANRREEIEQSVIKLCLWLELQYRVDTIAEKLSENVTVADMTSATASMLTYATAWPGELGYFSKSESDTPGVITPIAEDQKLFVKKVFEYTHKTKHNYICESKFGAVKIDLDRYNPFVINFSKQLEQGAVINVIGGRILSNIDNTVPTLMITQWFVD